MKKVILGFAACALVLSSCTENDILENEPVAQKIEFSNLNDRVTKAANADKDNYGVYALWSVESPAWYIPNLEVKTTVSGETETDSYDGAFYWPVGEGQTLSFYAYAPYKTDTEGVTEGVVTLPAATPTSPIGTSLDITYKVKPTVNEDFTIATPTGGINYNNTANKVTLSFNHMLSKIKIVPVLSEELEEAGYSLVDDSIVAHIKNVTQYQGTASLTNPIWKTRLVSTGVDYSRNIDKDWTFMIMPQETTEGIQIQLTGVEIKKDGTVYATDVTTDPYTFVAPLTIPSFDQNKFYTITLTISGSTGGVFGSKIEFSSSVADWTQESKTVEP